jgi:hypothetical protein
MPQKTFTNEQLATCWVKVAASGGTRKDVVLGVMSALGVENNAENYRKVYNNVTQRVKQLSSGTNPVTFPLLTAGRKGVRRSQTETDLLASILNGANTAPAVADAATAEEAVG